MVANEITGFGLLGPLAPFDGQAVATAPFPKD
jgi:hypothetical protein